MDPLGGKKDEGWDKEGRKGKRRFPFRERYCKRVPQGKEGKDKEKERNPLKEWGKEGGWNDPSKEGTSDSSKNYPPKEDPCSSPYFPSHLGKGKKKTPENPPRNTLEKPSKKEPFFCESGLKKEPD